ncbi:MAG: hypothetical protein VCD33_14820, partial [Alphaproteobacteria bacterium]
MVEATRVRNQISTSNILSPSKNCWIGGGRGEVLASRSGSRASTEIEFVNEEFHQQAEKTKFFPKVLIAFDYKEQVRLIERSELWPDRIVHRCWPEKLMPIDRGRQYDSPFWNLLAANFFSRAIGVFVKAGIDYELLHSAVYSYTSAFAQESLESIVTSYVEGLERLLEIFEILE